MWSTLLKLATLWICSYSAHGGGLLLSLSAVSQLFASPFLSLPWSGTPLVCCKSLYIPHHISPAPQLVYHTNRVPYPPPVPREGRDSPHRARIVHRDERRAAGLPPGAGGLSRAFWRMATLTTWQEWQHAFQVPAKLAVHQLTRILLCGPRVISGFP